MQKTKEKNKMSSYAFKLYPICLPLHTHSTATYTPHCIPPITRAKLNETE